MAGHLASLTRPEAEERIGADSVILVPIGAVEQHGPHLPLSVDHVIADEAARAVIERLGPEPDVWAVPTLPFSKSNEHAWSEGTIWLSSDTFQRVLDDMGRCVAQAGAGKVAFLNGHGGNTTLLNVMCRELRLSYGLGTFVLHPFPPPAYMPAGERTDDANELGMGIHGGRDETSVMLHLRPDEVDMSKAVRNVPEWLDENEHVKFGGSVGFGWLSNDFGPDGHIGDPTSATAERGEALFTAAVEVLCAQLAEIAAFEFPQ